MITEPISNEIELVLGSYRAAAAVLAYFHSDRLLPLDPKFVDESAIMELLEDCVQNTDGDASGPIRWMLKNSVRRQVLQQLGNRQSMKTALEANPERPDHPLQHAFDALINQTPLDSVNDIDGLYAQLQVCDWLVDIIDGLPDRNKLLGELELQQLLQPFREIAGVHFRGRTQELQVMRNFLNAQHAARSVYTSPPLMIHGPGGVGKSTLVAKFILDTLKESSSEQFAFAYLDFERAALWPEEPVTLLAEIIQQVSIQFPLTKPEAAALRNRWLHELVKAEVPADSNATLLRTVLRGDVVQSRSDTSQFLTEFGSFIQHISNSRQRYMLLVLDSFECVQRSRDLIARVFKFLNELYAFLPYLRIIISGRVQVAEYNTEPLLIGDLDADATDGFLESKGVHSHALRSEIFHRVGGDPLSLCLTVDVLKRDFDLITLEEFPQEFDALTLDHAQNQTWLYWRYLQRIRNILVQKLAHPGLVLRRITPDLIRHVLAEPCQVDVPDDQVATKLFEELAKEVSLVVRETPTRLRHRPDIRSRMLRGLMQDAGLGFFDIHRRAVAYYAQRPPDPISRAEEIYHRFFLGSSREVIDERWTSDQLEGLAAQLADALEEIPPAWQPYLAQRIGNTAHQLNWDEAEQRDWEPYAATRAAELMASNDYQGALKVLNERDARLSGSQLYRLKAICLEHLAQYPAAITCANEGIFSALQVVDAQLQWDLTLIALRSNEHLGRWGQARKLLAEAAAVEVKTEPPMPEMMALELDMHRLRLCRFDPGGCTENKAEVQLRCAELLTKNFEAVDRSESGLLINLLMEIGYVYPKLIAQLFFLRQAVFRDELGKSKLTAVVEEWLHTSNDISDDDESIVDIRMLLEKDDVVAATLRLLTFYSNRTLPSRLHAALITVLQATRQQTAARETLNQRLIKELQAALGEYFGDYDSFLKFLRAQFPAIESHIKEGGTYSSVLHDAAEAFEREGQTEALLRVLRQGRSSAALVTVEEIIQQINLGQISQPAVISGQIVNEHDTVGINSFPNRVVDTSGGPYIGGNVNTGGGDFIGRDKNHIVNHVYRTVLDVLPQAIPDSLTLASPIRTGMDVDPQALFNWAAAMRVVTQTVARLDTVKGYLSGFLIAPDLVMTLNFEQADEDLGKSQLRFQHILARSVAMFENPTLYSLEKSPPLWVNKQLRCAVFQIVGTPGTDLVPLTDTTRGWLRLAKEQPIPGEYACCLHFPGGETARLSSALVTRAARNKLNLTSFDKQVMMQYGSIGAPWFNERWEVIGLHLGVRPARRQRSANEAFLSLSWLNRLLVDKEFTTIVNNHLPPSEKPLPI